MSTPEQFLKRKEEIESVIDDTSNHMLDRVDACLELAQLLEKDSYQRARWVQVARDLLRKV